MRITKARLKKIIREEKARLLSESMHAHHGINLKEKFADALAQTGGYYNERIAQMAIDLLNSGELSPGEQNEIEDALDEFYTEPLTPPDLYESYATPGFEGSLMDQVDHGILEMKLNTLFQHFENAGYTREDIVYAIKGIIE